MAQDFLLFARNFIASPFRVAAVSPSSRFLAKAMAAGLGPSTGPVVEFGPGTGQLTRGILAAGVAPQNLTMFELTPEFCTLLTQRFAGTTVHFAGAQEAARLVPAGSAGAVVSGLPLLTMPDPVVEAILTAAFTVLRKGGEMRQFTYGPKPPIAPHILEKLGLVATAGRKVWANVPPARVYFLKRAADI